MAKPSSRRSPSAPTVRAAAGGSGGRPPRFPRLVDTLWRLQRSFWPDGSWSSRGRALLLSGVVVGIVFGGMQAGDMVRDRREEVKQVERFHTAPSEELIPMLESRRAYLVGQRTLVERKVDVVLDKSRLRAERDARDAAQREEYARRRRRPLTLDSWSQDGSK